MTSILGRWRAPSKYSTVDVVSQKFRIKQMTQNFNIRSFEYTPTPSLNPSNFPYATGSTQDLQPTHNLHLYTPKSAGDQFVRVAYRVKGHREGLKNIMLCNSKYIHTNSDFDIITKFKNNQKSMNKQKGKQINNQLNR